MMIFIHQILILFHIFSENVQNYSEVVLCGDEKSLRKASLGQHINSFQIIIENLVAVNKKPAMIQLKAFSCRMFHLGVDQVVYVQIVL